jgi:hypothetical protein
MEFTSPSNPNKVYESLGPLFWDKEIVGVTEHNHVLGSVRRSDLTGVRYEVRSSFKHPVFGAVLGTLLLALGIVLATYNPESAFEVIQRYPLRALGTIVGPIMFGAYLLWGVVRRRDVPWVVFITGPSEYALPLEAELTSAAKSVLAGMVQKPRESATRSR